MIEKLGDMDQRQNIGFIGTGIIGQGMAQNLLKAGHRVVVIANRNRSPIEKLVKLGAREATSLAEIGHDCSKVILCLPNSSTVISVCDTLFPSLSPGSMVVDCTTNQPVSVKMLAAKAEAANLRYVEAPLTGGQSQAENAKLGAILGCDVEDFEIARSLLAPCCTKIERFGNLGMGATTKLISNFLALGTATLVVEAMKLAREFGVDWEKFYELSSQGSGHSMSLDRIAPKAISGKHDGYAFTVENTVKDFEYITTMVREQPDAHAIAQIFLNIYQNAAEDGMQDAFISCRLKLK